MINYDNYHLEDFLNDDDFKDWVLSGAIMKGSFWERLLTIHPEKAADLHQAETIILNWKTETSKLSEVQRKADIKRIMSDVGELSESTERVINLPIKIWRFAAAAAVILLCLGWALWQRQISNDKYSYEMLVEKSDTSLKEISNNSQAPVLISLPDRSTVTLYPGSKISYPERFTHGDMRKVLLKGEAFFKVTKDANHPFLVFTKGITTRVVGTSFTINARADKVSVIVRTGKVSVYRMQEQNAKEKKDLLLTPNQQAIFSTKEDILTKMLAKNPVILADQNQNFQFDETPVTKIFESLQTSYGIEISVDAELFKNCNLTIPLNKEPFFTKLDIICRTIKAHYQITENKVIISGEGCN